MEGRQPASTTVDGDDESRVAIVVAKRACQKSRLHLVGVPEYGAYHFLLISNFALGFKFNGEKLMPERKKERSWICALCAYIWGGRAWH